MQTVTLNDIINENGIFIDGDWVESKDQDPNGEVRLIQLADIGDGYFINKSSRFLTIESAKKLKCTFLEPGDILVSRMPSPLGRACIFPGLDYPCVTVVDVCIIRPNKKDVSNEWLKYLINSFDFRNKISQFVTGTTRQRISRGNLAKIRFELTSLPDQIRIAKLLTQAENLIKQRKESIELLDDFLKSTFLKMFGDPTIGDTLTPLGIGLKLNGGAAFKSSDFKDFGIPAVKIGTINKGFFDISTFSYLPDSFKKIYSKYLIYPGDLLLSLTGTVGKDDYGNTCFATNSHKYYLLNQRVAKIIVDNKYFNINYIDYLFKFPTFKLLLLKSNRGVRQANLSNSDIYNIKINYPTLNLQNQFATIVEKVESLKKEYETSLLELENMYGVLSQKAFKGELNIK